MDFEKAAKIVGMYQGAVLEFLENSPELMELLLTEKRVLAKEKIQRVKDAFETKNSKFKTDAVFQRIARGVILSAMALRLVIETKKEVAKQEEQKKDKKGRTDKGTSEEVD